MNKFGNLRKNSNIHIVGKDKKMEKKIKFSDNPGFAKKVYGIVIAVLCITAIVIGIVAANNRGDGETPVEPPITGDNGNDEQPENPENPGEEPEEPKKLSFISPVVGSVVKNHDMSTPVFSATLEEWRIHSGIDISTPEGADVFAAEDGEVTKVYNDALLGYSVEITHSDEIKTVYSNLDPNSDVAVKVGDTVECGDVIGTIGDSSVSELAEEAHLHLEFIVGGKKANPLEYISKEAQESSLGIKVEE